MLPWIRAGMALHPPIHDALGHRHEHRGDAGEGLAMLVDDLNHLATGGPLRPGTTPSEDGEAHLRGGARVKSEAYESEQAE